MSKKIVLSEWPITILTAFSLSSLKIVNRQPKNCEYLSMKV